MACTPPDSPPERRHEILDAALALLEAHGYRHTSMLQVATLARASKNTVYQHFPTKQALFASLVARAAARTNEELLEALDSHAPPGPAMFRFGHNLLDLLCSPTSIAINRAAIAEARQAPELAQELVSNGRSSTGALVMRYLAQQMDAGLLCQAPPPEAFESFLGLLVGDLQVRLLLGVQEAPSAAELRQRAQRATEQFMRLYGVDAAGPARNPGAEPPNAINTIA